jgi:selenocysteine lyase/cysteine desulfurase
VSQLREQFPLLARCVYLDVAHKAPLSVAVRRAIDRFCAQALEGGGDRSAWAERVEATRAKIARLIRAEPDEIAFVKNASEGINLLAHSVPYTPGDNVIITDQEHEANDFPWVNLERRGVEVRRVKCRDYRFTVEDVERLSDDRTRVVSLSHVYPVSGFSPDVPAISRFCGERAVLLFLDVVQSAGAVPIDARVWGVDGMAASGHKWLLGPYGQGFLYARSAFTRRATSVFASKLYSRRDAEDANTARAADARRWEYGSPNYLGIHALEAGIDLVLEIGLEGIARRVAGLTRSLHRALRSLGLSPSLGFDPPPSGILSFRVRDPDRTAARLQEQGVFVSARRGLVRASVHFYNSDDDLERFLTCLARAL